MTRYGWSAWRCRCGRCGHAPNEGDALRAWRVHYVTCHASSAAAAGTAAALRTVATAEL